MVRWELTDCSQRQENITGYDLSLMVDGVVTSTFVRGKNETQYLLDFLTPKTWYKVTVAIAYNDRLVGQYSEEVQFRTQGTTTAFETK